MEFRRLTTNELNPCFTSRLRAFEKSPTAFLTTLEEEKAHGPARYAALLENQGADNVIFGAIVAGTVLGTVGLRREDRNKTSHKASIWGMYVDVDQRKCGIGVES